MGLPRPYAISKPLTITKLILDRPGQGEVLVKVAAAGLCHSDLSVINGDRMPAMAAELARRPVAVLVTAGGEPAALAARAAPQPTLLRPRRRGDRVKEGARATLRSTSLTRHALRDISSSASSLSSIRRGGLIRAGVAQDPETPLLVGHVDVAARVDEHVLRLGHKIAR
jgi:hypothetical protein